MIPFRATAPEGIRTMQGWFGGSGSPTVVFEAGLGCHSAYWGDLPARVAAITTVVTYDRAGLGESEPRNNAPTPAAFAADLASVLDQADAAPPYLLVGHSFGGFLIRAFVTRFPENVGGLLFVDSATENEMEGLSERVKKRDSQAGIALKVNAFLTRFGFGRLWFVRNQTRRAFPRYSESHVDSILAAVARPGHWRTNLEEYQSYQTLFDDARSSRTHEIFRRVPLSVVTAVAYPEPHLKAFEMSREQFREFHLGRQREALVSLSPTARQIVAEESGHMVQHDQPELLLSEISALVDHLR